MEHYPAEIFDDKVATFGLLVIPKLRHLKRHNYYTANSIDFKQPPIDSWDDTESIDVCFD